MLRAKQLANLSSSARSFLISGPRCSAADGSCSCADDEGCSSKRLHQKNNAASLSQNSSSITLGNASSRKSSALGNAVKCIASKKDEKQDHTSPLRQAKSVATSVEKYDSVSYAIGDVSSPVPSVSDQLLRAGMTAFTCLSDLMSHGIPTSISVPQSCMVDSSRPVSNVEPSKSKVAKKEGFVNVHPKNSVKASVDSSSKKVGSKQASFKAPRQLSNDADCQSSGVESTSAVYDSMLTTPPNSKAPSNCSTSGVDFSEADNTYVAKQFSKGGSRRNSNGYKLPTRPYPNSEHVVANVSHLLRHMKWSSSTEEALKNQGLHLDPYQANQVLKQLQDYSVALEFFYWLKRQPGFKHDGHTYTTMIGILGRAKQFAAIDKLLNQMMRDGCHPNVVTYNRLIHSYGRANYLNDAVEVFNQMQKVGCEPDKVTYCTIIDIHAKAGYLEFAMDMYRRMLAAGLSPDTFTYSVMINCLGKAGHLASAQKLFREMVERGCTPNLVTFNIMIALQAKARNYQSALRLYRDMQNAGFQPDKVTFSIVMEVLGHCGYLSEAEAVFREMRCKNWVPDEPVYGLLVDLWGKSGNVGKAWYWYQAMLDTGMRPNVPTCNSLLNAFLRVNHLNDAHSLIQTMLDLGLKPSLQTYTLLLSFCTEATSQQDMSICCELMAVTGHPAHQILLSMPSSGPDGQNVKNHMSNFLDMFHSEDRESKRGLVDALVDFLHKSGLKEEAGSVWEVAAQKNLYPDAVKEKSSTYWLINLHVMSDGTAVTALSRTLAWFRQQMLISGVGPSRIDIITGWGRRSRVTGTSLVRQAVVDLLSIFSFPFFTENGNSGCFIGCGEPLSRWLLHSYVDRMHLL